MDTTVVHQMILENMSGGVLSIDLKGRVTTFNPAAEKLLGLECKEVVGKTFAEIFLEITGSDDFVQVVLDAIYDDTVTHHQRIDFPSGEGMRRLDMTTSFLFAGDSASPQARRVGVVAVFDDVTEIEALREFARAAAAQRVQQLVTVAVNNVIGSLSEATFWLVLILWSFPSQFATQNFNPNTMASKTAS